MCVLLVLPILTPLFPEIMSRISTARVFHRRCFIARHPAHSGLSLPGLEARMPAHHCHLTSVRSFHSEPVLPSDAT